MNRFQVVLAATCVLQGTLAEAAQRTFVASYGNDANPCSIAQPCRGFAAALAVTSNAGEIIVLDSAGYGSLTINKGVTISAPAGVYAGITAAFAQDAVVINAPNDYVILRGLDIKGGEFGITGINYQAGVGLTVENCTISNVAFHGMAIAAVDSRVSIVGSTFRLNGQNGLVVTEPSKVTVARSAFIQNVVSGIHVGNNGVSPVLLSVSDSVFSNNAFFGIDVDVALPSTVVVSIAGSTITGGSGGISANGGLLSTVLVTATGNSIVENYWGFLNSGTAKMVLSGNVISRNLDFGVNLQPGSNVLSAGNNLISDNVSGQTSSPLGYIPLQ